MKTRIYVPDIECDSCVRVISKILERREGVSGFVVKKDSVEVEHEPLVIATHSLVGLIHEKGFRAGLEPFTQKTFTSRIRDLLHDKEKHHIERTMLGYWLGSLILLLIVDVVAYFALFSQIPDFLNRYDIWMSYINLAVVSIGSAIWHFRSYKAQMTHMVGMMIGMTFGMQSGLMIGTIIGATNGMLVGSLTGMLIGVGVGISNGKCCGIMGVLEGMMAGVMGGTMGAMLGVMLLVDHIEIFMPVFSAINIIILWGLSYMLYEEVVEHNPKTIKQPVAFSTFFACCLIASSALIALMVYGPKTGIVGGW